MKKIEFKTNPKKLAADILFREGLDQMSIVMIFVQDYYANIALENTQSVRDHFYDSVLKNKDGKAVYSKSIQHLLVSFYQENCGELLTIKKKVYEFMSEGQDLWSMDYVSEFMDFVFHHTDEFLESEKNQFDWKIDELVFAES